MAALRVGCPARAPRDTADESVILGKIPRCFGVANLFNFFFGKRKVFFVTCRLPGEASL
ncbi:hypothetical protein FRAHR75_760030 [Frankia sp. Hr75.2]|nr:hypothetical protein FRAHR75_760030 [Frankia sp. Hr75.2]SQE00223.1 hypothetical protein FMEAI12_6300003 [Parafrankia sp. Ea1.12]